jgi:hypothetical protein
MKDVPPWIPNNSHQRHRASDGHVTDEELQAEAMQRAPEERPSGTPKQQVDRAIKTIRKKSKQLSDEGSTETEGQHIEMLKTIYSIGRRLDDEDHLGQVTASLEEQIGAKPGREFFDLLIEAALPEVPKKIRKIWAGAATYAHEAHIRPRKLAGFIWIKGGLTKCGQTVPSVRRREIARWRRSLTKPESSDD